jgi:hypothetical protein
MTCLSEKGDRGKVPFNADHFRKLSAYCFNKSSILLFETYELNKVEHVMMFWQADDIPNNVDRVVRMFGDGSWFNPVNTHVLYCCIGGDIAGCEYTRNFSPNYPIGPIYRADFTKKKVYLFHCEMRDLKSWGSFRPKNRDHSSFLNDMDLKFVERPKALKPKVTALVKGHVSNLRDPDLVPSPSTSAGSGPLSGSTPKDEDGPRKRRVRGRKPKSKAKDLSDADVLAASLADIKFLKKNSKL